MRYCRSKTIFIQLLLLNLFIYLNSVGEHNEHFDKLVVFVACRVIVVDGHRGLSMLSGRVGRGG